MNTKEIKKYRAIFISKFKNDTFAYRQSNFLFDCVSDLKEYIREQELKEDYLVEEVNLTVRTRFTS